MLEMQTTEKMSSHNSFSDAPSESQDRPKLIDSLGDEKRYLAHHRIKHVDQTNTIKIYSEDPRKFKFKKVKWAMRYRRGASSSKVRDKKKDF